MGVKRTYPGAHRSAGIMGLLVMLAASQSVYGGHIQPPVQLRPDITAGNILVEYDAATGVFTAIGKAKYVDFDGAEPMDYPIQEGTFVLTMNINKSAPAQSTGTLEIGGAISGLGIAKQLLLSAELNAFGYGESSTDNPSDFEFTFHGASGVLAPYYSPSGFVSLHATGLQSFSGSFETSFTNAKSLTFNGQTYYYGTGTADVSMTPEPSSVVMLAGLCLAAPWIAARRRRRHLKRTQAAD